MYSFHEPIATAKANKSTHQPQTTQRTTATTRGVIVGLLAERERDSDSSPALTLA